MSQITTIQVENPISSVTLLENSTGSTKALDKEKNTKATFAESQEAELKTLTDICQALQDAVNKVNDYQENLFKRHKEQIAKLSVEISRKVLMQKVQEGDYKIESIIKEALENAPTRKDIIVHLNPEDFVQCEKLKQNDTGTSLAGIKFVSDPGIGRAECLLETPKGTIESLIEEHLERIGKALEKAD
jgi:flagellar biosynthesis/type III secretory pathway protein FliH